MPRDPHITNTVSGENLVDKNRALILEGEALRLISDFRSAQPIKKEGFFEKLREEWRQKKDN